MGIFDFLKKKDKNENSKIKRDTVDFDNPMNGTPSGIKINDIDIKIRYYNDDSVNNISDDYEIVLKEGLDKLIKNKLIPWLLNDQFADRDVDKVIEGLKLYEADYHYDFICAEYSPTKKDDMFGQFEFDFESSSEYTKDILQAVAMEVYIYEGKIVDVDFFDI